jgi:hypothetical protein
MLDAMRTAHNYQRGRDQRIATGVLASDQLAFMRYCNELAREFEKYAPPMTFGELAALHLLFKTLNERRPAYGMDASQWSEKLPDELIALEELTGCLLGIRRMDK